MEAAAALLFAGKRLLAWARRAGPQAALWVAATAAAVPPPRPDAGPRAPTPSRPVSSARTLCGNEAQVEIDPGPGPAAAHAHAAPVPPEHIVDPHAPSYTQALLTAPSRPRPPPPAAFFPSLPHTAARVGCFFPSLCRCPRLPLLT